MENYEKSFFSNSILSDHSYLLVGETVINGDLFCRFGYQIELVCHYGTMLQLKTKNKPKTCQEALQLAIEQEIIAPCTTMLPGISLEDHACALLKSDYWFFHERP